MYLPTGKPLSPFGSSLASLLFKPGLPHPLPIGNSMTADVLHHPTGIG